MSLNIIIVKLFRISKNQFLKNLCSGTQCGGFQFLLILDQCVISYHAVVVFGLGKNLLFKSVLGHCVQILLFSMIFRQFSLATVYSLQFISNKSASQNNFHTRSIIMEIFLACRIRKTNVVSWSIDPRFAIFCSFVKDKQHFSKSWWFVKLHITYFY